LLLKQGVGLGNLYIAKKSDINIPMEHYNFSKKLVKLSLN